MLGDSRAVRWLGSWRGRCALQPPTHLMRPLKMKPRPWEGGLAPHVPRTPGTWVHPQPPQDDWREGRGRWSALCS